MLAGVFVVQASDSIKSIVEDFVAAIPAFLKILAVATQGDAFRIVTNGEVFDD